MVTLSDDGYSLAVWTCRGRYQTEPQPGALHATRRCPAPVVLTASAGARAQGIHDTLECRLEADRLTAVPFAAGHVW